MAEALVFELAHAPRLAGLVLRNAPRGLPSHLVGFAGKPWIDGRPDVELESRANKTALASGLACIDGSARV